MAEGSDSASEPAQRCNDHAKPETRLDRVREGIGPSEAIQVTEKHYNSQWQPDAQTSQPQGGSPADVYIPLGRAQALAGGATAFLPKPFDSDVLLDAVRSAFQRR